MRPRTINEGRVSAPVATFLLLHGAAWSGWYWHLVEPFLAAAGHETLAPDLPADDPAAGLSDYAATAIDALDGYCANQLVVVAQSMAGFYAPIVAEAAAVDRLVLVAAMVPNPGERGHDWWANTHQPAAQRACFERLGLDTADLGSPDVVYGHDIHSDAWGWGSAPNPGSERATVRRPVPDQRLGRHSHPRDRGPRRPAVPCGARKLRRRRSGDVSVVVGAAVAPGRSRRGDRRGLSGQRCSWCGHPGAGHPGRFTVGMWCYHDVMAVRKLSVALEESVAAEAAEAAERRGVSLSAWLNAAAERALVIERGLAGVAEWESEHGELSAEELAWADSVLDRSVAGQVAS